MSAPQNSPDLKPGLWLYSSSEGEVEGPVAYEKLLELVEKGELKRDVLVCLAGTENWIPFPQSAPKPEAETGGVGRSAELLANARQWLSIRIKKAGSEMRQIAGATYERSRFEVKIRSLQSQVSKIDKEIDFKLMRDLGARAMAEGVELSGHEELMKKGHDLQRVYELANQAGIAGDKEKVKEAKAAALQLQELHIKIGSAVLENDLTFPGSSEILAKRENLREERQEMEASIEKLRLQIAEIPDEKQKKAKVGFASVALLLLCGLVAAWAYLFSGPPVVTSVENSEVLEKAVGFIVVGLAETKPNGDESEHVLSTGSGFLVSPKGYLVTNKHVIQFALAMQKRSDLKQRLERRTDSKIQEKIWVFFRDRKYLADLVYVSNHYDLAILKLQDAPRSMKPVFALSTGEPSRGARVHAIGFPAASSAAITEDELAGDMLRESSSMGSRKVSKFFRDDELIFTQTSGEVSRTREDSDSIQWIQHTAIVTPGNSGGPLIDDNGLVLGINTLTGQLGAGVNLSFSPRQCRKELEAHVKGLKWK